jgi:hypothetical protein
MAALDDERCRYGTINRTDDSIAFAVHQLDGAPPTVEALHAEFLDAAAGDHLRFTHDASDALAQVRQGTDITAYILPPTTPERILRAVERGERLPRKSTFFWPKPRTGMALMPVFARA